MTVLDLFRLDGQVAIVTGGSRGLGLEMATALGEAGAAIAITARREEGLATARETLERKNITCASFPCDVANEDQVTQTVSAVVQRFGQIDILFNNAGIAWGASIESMPLEKWRSVFDTNVTGSFLMARAAASRMIDRGRGGAIVNIASVAGLVGMPSRLLDAVGYSASKGAVISLTRDLAVKWARHGVRVNAVAPGFFETRMSEGVVKKAGRTIEQMTPLGRIGRPGELKGVVLFLASAASSYITGQVLAVDGGMTAS